MLDYSVRMFPRTSTEKGTQTIRPRGSTRPGQAVNHHRHHKPHTTNHSFNHYTMDIAMDAARRRAHHVLPRAQRQRRRRARRRARPARVHALRGAEHAVRGAPRRRRLARRPDLVRRLPARRAGRPDGQRGRDAAGVSLALTPYSDCTSPALPCPPPPRHTTPALVHIHTWQVCACLPRHVRAISRNADAPARLPDGTLVFAKPLEEEHDFGRFLDHVVRQQHRRQGRRRR